jgi:hypothetical protein
LKASHVSSAEASRGKINFNGNFSPVISILFLTGVNHLRPGTDKSRKEMNELLCTADARTETFTDSETNRICAMASLMKV